MHNEFAAITVSDMGNQNVEIGMKRRLTPMAVSATALVLAACSAGPKPVPGAVPSQVTQSAIDPQGSDVAPSSTIRPFDTVSITVLREPELTIESVVVDQDGGFMMPLVGRVNAAGMTPIEVAEEIRSDLAANYLVNPIVSVNITNYTSHIVTVEGSVEDPGMYQFQPQTTLLGALALANGPNPTVSDLSEVAIFRSFEDETRVAVFDVKKIRAGQAPDPRIAPGDRVVVGFSALGEGLENFLRTVPLIGIFTRF